MPDHVGSGGRGILELIVFVSGGVLLSLEIVASRVLAPYFGNSIYVWGSLIGVAYDYFGGYDVAIMVASASFALAALLYLAMGPYPEGMQEEAIAH